MHANQTVGKYGERVAARHLLRRGYEILETNWRGRAGELDIIARQDRVLVIVEVKTRRTMAFGHPASAVDFRKLGRMKELAIEWLRGQSEFYPEIRFDVIAVLTAPRGAAQLEHLQAVV
ncbi:MAG TPA: YraN family protein [Actinomycetales bacterium]|nr:YraN family protein [Actinomycetales bacterium]